MSESGNLSENGKPGESIKPLEIGQCIAIQSRALLCEKA